MAGSRRTPADASNRRSQGIRDLSAAGMAFSERSRRVRAGKQVPASRCSGSFDGVGAKCLERSGNRTRSQMRLALQSPVDLELVSELAQPRCIEARAQTEFAGAGNEVPALSIITPLVEKHVDHERRAVSSLGIPELGYRPLGQTDGLKDIRLDESFCGVVVRPVADSLEIDELQCDILEFCREAHLLLAGDLLAPALGPTMIQGAVCLPPGSLAPVRLLSTDQQVRAGRGDTVEQGVVGGADGSSQVRLSRPTGSPLAD